jgi:peptidylprolyl isomerase
MDLRRATLAACILAAFLASNATAATPPGERAATPAAAKPETTADVLAAAKPGDWRRPRPEDTLYLDLPGGRAVIELAPGFAPAHVENIRTLARQRYWDGLPIVRVQENYVVQWGDPAAGSDAARALGAAKAALPAEFDRASDDLAFTRLPDGDVYAPQVGWSNGFPAARDPAGSRAWMAHCYAAVGAGRGDAADSSTGTELYVVIGHSPRHLDRNITLVGRVLQGMEHLTTLPRGTGALGFYEQAAQRVPIRSIRLASELPADERIALEVLRTDTPLFERYVATRRNRRESWFIDPVGRVELCNIAIPTRVAAAPGD